MSKWVKAEKQLPDASTKRVIVWANEQIEFCWFSNENFYVYDGTWMITNKNELAGVTHWTPIDWMESKEVPLHGPKLKHKLLHHWYKITDRAQDMAYDMRPAGWGSKAQLDRKVVFYRDSSGKVMSGLPENIPAPRGYEKIVCNNVFEAERYSELQRRQERFEHRAQQESRGAIENEFANEIRSEMRTKMANARNATNREFMRRALERMDNRKDPTAYERESYLHAEAFEDRH